MVGSVTLRLYRSVFLRKNSSSSFTNCEWNLKGGEKRDPKFLMLGFPQVRLKMGHFGISSKDTCIAHHLEVSLEHMG